MTLAGTWAWSASNGDTWQMIKIHHTWQSSFHLNEHSHISPSTALWIQATGEVRDAEKHPLCKWSLFCHHLPNHRRRRGWRGWDGWMASPTWWTWVWASSRSWWWRGKPGVLQSMGSQSRTWLSEWTDLTTTSQPTAGEKMLHELAMFIWPDWLFLTPPTHHFVIHLYQRIYSAHFYFSHGPSICVSPSAFVGFMFSQWTVYAMRPLEFLSCSPYRPRMELRT